MKKVIVKIFLYISFVPYAYIILSSIYACFYGYNEYTWIKPAYIRTIYGIEALKTVFLWNTLRLTVTLILPICMIYQTIYLLLHIRKKQKKYYNLCNITIY